MVDYSAKILADSVNPVGNRITTFELTYPRFIHAELLTHRMFSRNSASSRAIPTKKLMARIRDFPVMPKWWGRNQSGMQAFEELEDSGKELSEQTWLAARDAALVFHQQLQDLGLHKQIANRIIEPWMFITVILTATEYDNFFHLRDHEAAQPEIAWLAREMRQLYDSSEPTSVAQGGWHVPLVEPPWGDAANPLYVSEYDYNRLGGEESLQGFLAKISAARCARVSYLTHDGKRDLIKDLELHDRLAASGHWSPFEHPAQAMNTSDPCGNFYGWAQYRKRFPNEHYGRDLP